MRQKELTIYDDFKLKKTFDLHGLCKIIQRCKGLTNIRSTYTYRVCICMLRGSTHYCAIAPRVLSHHIEDFLGSRRMETAPTSIEVILHPTLVQSHEPSDLRDSDV